MIRYKNYKSLTESERLRLLYKITKIENISLRQENIDVILEILKLLDKPPSSSLNKQLANLLVYASADEIYYCYSEYNKLTLKQKASTSREFQILRYGTIEGIRRYTTFCKNAKKNQEKRKLNKNYKNICKESSIFCIEYYIKRGYTKEEAKLLISKIQSENSNKVDFKSRITPIHIEYYLNRGYSLTESKKLRSERQSTFTLEKCIKKHGLEEGTKIFKNRQIKWQNTMNSKPIEEQEKIRKSRMVKLTRSSKKSLKIFIPFYKKLRKAGFERNDIKFGINGSKEFGIYCQKNKSYCPFDFTILSKKIIIEFQGKQFHSKTLKEAKEKRSIYNKEVSLEGTFYRDILKKEIAEQHNFKVYYFWEDENKENEQIQKDILTFLNL